MLVHVPKPRHELLTAKIARLFYRDSDRTSSIGAREVTLAIHSIEPRGFRFGLHLQLDAELRSMIPGRHYNSSPCGPRLPGCGGRSGGFLARPTIWSGLTGTRESFRPVASRKAATTAGVEAIVGGSPTPLSP